MFSFLGTHDRRALAIERWNLRNNYSSPDGHRSLPTLRILLQMYEDMDNDLESLIDPLTKDFQTFHPLPIMPSLNGDNDNHRGPAASPTRPAPHPQNSESEPSSSGVDHMIGLDRRQFIYRHSLYVKHIPSNRYTRFYPVSSKHFIEDRSKQPSPRAKLDGPAAKLITRTTRFLQRELRAIDPVLLAHPINHSIRVILVILHQVDSNSPQAVHLFSQLISDSQLAQHFSQ
ncbi:hypothetical protein PtA15_3A910 [Puccinia triticina]|uniref:Uncharacterized protein n=1 Tax=Puccinia triticina TaxID=208348 RepID=A0ABY7CEP3_9BASI|nr:uncharacterized protein PtA15_3A910 [Puccinia triticina]WAQ83539.1 hypothetical protein PtA15_3A910 [Puccinia triticina]